MAKQTQNKWYWWTVNFVTGEPITTSVYKGGDDILQTEYPLIGVTAATETLDPQGAIARAIELCPKYKDNQVFSVKYQEIAGDFSKKTGNKVGRAKTIKF